MFPDCFIQLAAATCAMPTSRTDPCYADSIDLPLSLPTDFADSRAHMLPMCAQLGGMTPNWEVLSGKEGETNWNKRDEFINQLTVLIENGKLGPNLTVSLKHHWSDVLCTIHSARTQLVLSACRLLRVLAHALPSEEWDQMTEVTLAGIFRLCGNGKKLVASTAQSTLQAVMLVAPPAKVAVAVLGTLNHEKNPALRQRVTSAFAQVVLSEPDRWFTRSVSDMEQIVLKAISDATSEVRDQGADLFLVAQKRLGFDPEV